jgi:general stress protein 26
METRHRQANRPGLTDDDRQFLERPRIGFLTPARRNGWPTPVPVWFECVDQSVQLFTSATSPKVRRIRSAGRASLIAANEVGEPEHWVAIVGPARIDPDRDSAHELAARLAGRYWDLNDPARARTLDAWRSEQLIRIIIDAEQVTRYA